MKGFIGNFIILISLLGSLYVGGWLMFMEPIIEVYKSFEDGTLTGTMIGIMAIKCLLATTVGFTIFYLGSFFGSVFLD